MAAGAGEEGFVPGWQVGQGQFAPRNGDTRFGGQTQHDLQRYAVEDVFGGRDHEHAVADGVEVAGGAFADIPKRA
ncbi:MAG: hypothetical protein R2873_15075 [Caldilineaceae bacterium]